MSEPRSYDPTLSGSGSSWGVPVVPLLCESCDWRYLAPAGSPMATPGSSEVPATCPHCASDAIVVLDPDEARFPYAVAPELIVPFSISPDTIDADVMAFAEGIPYPPQDLNPDALRQRLRRIYLPMWLVDSDVEARWQAEVGFDYQVVSHQERYADGAGWQTAEVHEGRVRWEPRVGRLNRRYENVSAPALTQHAMLTQAVGTHTMGDGVRYRPELLADILVRAPDRAPDAAWAEAEVGVRQRATEECQQAAGAHHIRDFHWSPRYVGQRWTLLLLPLYATHYYDDDARPQRVLLNGQTGRLYGVKRGSMARASRISLIIGIIALVIFLGSLALGLFGAVFPPLFAISLLGAVVGLVIGAAAIVPVARVWTFNRREAQTREGS